MLRQPMYLMIGGVREDYSITPDGRAISGVVGGNAIYAAVGARLWSSQVAVISRVGSNYPRTWLNELESRDISVSHVRILDGPQDTRTFYAYRTTESRIDTNPAAHYHSLGLPLPKELIGYQNSTRGQQRRDQLTPLAVRPSDLDTDAIAGARGAHLSPAEFLSHLTIPSVLSKRGIEAITLDPSMRYMQPGFHDDLSDILHGIQAFLPSVMEANAFFPGMEGMIWDIADAFHAMGPPFIIIKAGSSGQYLLDGNSRKRWRIPAYPTTVKDVTGAGDAFCGAFLTGLVETGDPLEAAMRGNIASSCVIEGSGALYALDVPPELLLARFKELRLKVRQE